MKLPLRIAILECDTPLDKTREQFGGYGGVFKLLLQRGADRLNHPGLGSKEGLELSFFNVSTDGDKHPRLEDIDAILITGSRYNSFDDTPWILKLVEFVKGVLQQARVRTIGVCFGHQIVGRALGLPVARSVKGWEVSVVPLELTNFGKTIFGSSKLSIFQMHRDIVDGYPDDIELLGSTERCTNQGMYKKGKYITVQGHPEFTHDIVEEILETRQKQGIFPDGVFEEGMRRLRDHDDGVQVAAAFLQFLLDD